MSYQTFCFGQIRSGFYGGLNGFLSVLFRQSVILLRRFVCVLDEVNKFIQERSLGLGLYHFLFTTILLFTHVFCLSVFGRGPCVGMAWIMRLLFCVFVSLTGSLPGRRLFAVGPRSHGRPDCFP